MAKSPILRRIKYLESAWRVLHLAGREPAQFYHANDANTLPAAWCAAKRSHAKIVYDAHEFETGRFFSSDKIARFYRKIWVLPEKLFIHRANSIITVSPSIAERTQTFVSYTNSSGDFKLPRNIFVSSN